MTPLKTNELGATFERAECRGIRFGVKSKKKQILLPHAGSE